jgi:hypothetical protein
MSLFFTENAMILLSINLNYMLKKWYEKAN